jgi:hypothetical protein
MLHDLDDASVLLDAGFFLCQMWLVVACEYYRYDFGADLPNEDCSGVAYMPEVYPALLDDGDSYRSAGHYTVKGCARVFTVHKQRQLRLPKRRLKSLGRLAFIPLITSNILGQFSMHEVAYIMPILPMPIKNPEQNAALVKQHCKIVLVRSSRFQPLFADDRNVFLLKELGLGKLLRALGFLVVESRLSDRRGAAYYYLVG